MSELTNYIKERIAERKKLKWERFSESWNERQNEIIEELQAVLSKIEEIDKNDWTIIKWEKPSKS